jgi:hypothetical protein
LGRHSGLGGRLVDSLTLLTDYAVTVNAQFGEDGIVRECLRRMGILKGGVAVEVGASDGRECSNTLELRDVFGWTRVLIEADEILFNRMEEHERDVRIHSGISPTGITRLDVLTRDYEVDFLSLDIDGDEYEVWHNLEMAPWLVCIEFNQTIPWQFSITNAGMGCSLSALCTLAERKDYAFIGATHCNAFFVRSYDADYFFKDIDRDPEHYLDPKNFTYLITTPYGGAVAFGPQHFSVQKRFSGELSVIDYDGNVRTINLSHRSTRG